MISQRCQALNKIQRAPFPFGPVKAKTKRTKPTSSSKWQRRRAEEDERWRQVPGRTGPFLEEARLVPFPVQNDCRTKATKPNELLFYDGQTKRFKLKKNRWKFPPKIICSLGCDRLCHLSRPVLPPSMRDVSSLAEPSY